MEGNLVVERARAHQAPSEWNVWPLRRDYVLNNSVKSGLLGLVGLGLFIPAALITIPADFGSADGAHQVMATLILAVLLALAAGGLGVAAYDAWRLSRSNQYWLIITPELFVKATPAKIIETPLEYVANLTLKGVALPTEGNSMTAAPMDAIMPTSVGARMIGLANVAGAPGVSRQRARGSASLAYRDSRDNSTVTVCTDDAFDHMGAIYQILRERAAKREEQVWRASWQAPRPS